MVGERGRYGPLEPNFDESWKLPDVERLSRSS
jgi:hypothetical protein